MWDESLFAITAAKWSSGDWIGTTFLGSLDYYNTKPPLRVWLVALAFKAFGPGLVTLRLPAMLAAWLTVAVLLWWAARAFGRAIGVVAGLVLATLRLPLRPLRPLGQFRFALHAARAADGGGVGVARPSVAARCGWVSSWGWCSW